jgi:GntR family transcriptional regulator/MocR family aminotransferase
MDPDFELPISLPPQGSRNLLRALHGQLRAAILDGRLQPGMRLPPSRAFASAYGVSRNTAVATYDLLLSEGYLAARPRAGVYVADVRSHQCNRKPRVVDPATDPRLNAFWRDPPVGWFEFPRTPPRFDFRSGVPDHRLFPFDIWRRLSARALRTYAKADPGYPVPQGRPALREAIAKHVSFARAVACRPEDIVVTTGAQQAFDLLARILVTPGRTVVAIESPGYPPLRTSFEAVGARIFPVRVDQEGIDVERLPRNARVVCVAPSHEFPLGATMSPLRRTALLEFARERRAVIIEDDYDGEFRLSGRPLDALQTLDRAELVFYVGTFSKSLFPAIRLGFVVAPPWARRALVAAKQSADWQCSALEQATLAAFIDEGHLARHVRKMRRIYRTRHDVLLKGLHKDFGRWLEPLPSVVGMHMAALAKSPIDVQSIAKRARAQDVGVYTLREYQFIKPFRPGFVFGYGAIGESEIGEALARLRRVWVE